MMSNIRFVDTLLILSVVLAKTANGKPFDCYFDLCDTADGQFCNIKDKRCNYCSITECTEGVKECKEYCNKIYSSHKTTPIAEVTIKPTSETHIQPNINIGFKNLSLDLQIIIGVILFACLAVLALLIFQIGYKYHREEWKKDETKVVKSKSCDSGVYEIEDLNQTTSSMSSEPKFPVQAVANKDTFEDKAFDPCTTRLLVGDQSGGYSGNPSDIQNDTMNRFTTAQDTYEINHEEQETNLKRTY